MRKLLLALALALASSTSWAQCTGVFPSNTLCGNLTGSPAPPAAFSAAGTVVGPSASTSGFFATWGNNLGTLLSSVTSVSTSQAVTWAASQFFSGVTSQSNASVSSLSVTSTFVYLNTNITSIAIPGSPNTFSGNNTFSGTTSFTGPLVATSTVSLTTPLSIAFGGTGRTSFPIPSTTQIFTTGTSLTYVTPTTNPSPAYLLVRMCGGGGGGGAQVTNPGTAGTYTQFQSWTTLGGAGGQVTGVGNGGAGGTGGANGTGTLILRQDGGFGAPGAGAINAGGGMGGISALGGYGGVVNTGGATGKSAPATTCGGGGAGGTIGTAITGGGGAGEYVEFQLTGPLSVSYLYTIGTSGAGGTAGTQAGGAGGGGRIIVREFYE